MNAAILLLSSAWMVGQTPDVIIPVSHNSCGSNCGTCCDSGPSLRDRIRGLFQRDCCPQPCPQPRCHEVRCHDTCRQPRCSSFHWPQLNLGNRCCPSSCDSHGHRACQTTCHTACDNCGPSLLDRIRGAFHRDCGCNAGCHTNCCTSSGAAPAAEPLKDQPKKMPSKNDPKKATEARVLTTPAQTLPAIQNAPVIVPAPTAAPRIIENDSRNPF